MLHVIRQPGVHLADAVLQQGEVTAATTTRSGSNAAQVRTCGPPPEKPQVASRPTPSSAQIARTSAAQSAMLRPGWAVDPP